MTVDKVSIIELNNNLALLYDLVFVVTSLSENPCLGISWIRDNKD